MLSKKEWKKLSLFVVLGGIAGWSYYYFIGCNNGCALQSNAYIMTAYGAFTGGILGFPVKKKQPEEEKPEN